jgi:hypothetical protein
VIATSGTVSGSTTVTVNPASIPSAWQHQDVGAVNPLGSANFSSGVFTVQGSGDDIWGTQDAFHYVYQSLPADGDVAVRVTSVQNTSVNAKAGIMVRASLRADSPHVILDLKPNSEIEFMTRTTAQGSTSWLSGANQIMPAWLKLARAGSTVTGYSSADGVTWNRVGTTMVAFANPAYIGFVVSSHASGVLNTSTFDNVVVRAAPPAGGSCSSLAVTKPVLWSGHYESNWSITVTSVDSTCTWTASVDQAWMGFNPTAANPAGDSLLTGTGTIQFRLRVQTNNTSPSVFRFGRLTVGNQVFTVTQEP